MFSAWDKMTFVFSNVAFLELSLVLKSKNQINETKNIALLTVIFKHLRFDYTFDCEPVEINGELD